MLAVTFFEARPVSIIQSAHASEPSDHIAYVTAQYVPSPVIPSPKKAPRIVQDVSNLKSEYIAYLRSIAGPWFDLQYRIVMAESGFQANAKNKSSTASGLAQFINGTFKSQCIDKYKFAESMAQKNDPYVQLNCLNAMIRNNGQSHWYASRAGWE